MDREKRFDVIFATIDLGPALSVINKRSPLDILFRLDCGFLLSESIPSEASSSRLIRK